MRLVFMGTPEFSLPVLMSLLEAGHEVASVYSQPPRPSGRGQKTKLSPVHAYAESQGLPVCTPADLGSPEEQFKFSSLNVELGIVVAYGLILPSTIFDAPHLGCINLHASLLPRWRGAAPIQRAILAGDKFTGVSIMKIESGLDIGQIFLSEKVPITPQTTAQNLHDDLAKKGASLMVEALAGIDTGTLHSVPQVEVGVTYASKLKPIEGKIDWTQPAVLLERQVRALNPWPGVWFEFGGNRMKVLAAKAEAEVGERDRVILPGTTIDNKLGIACGSGILRLTKLCQAGKASLDASTYLRGSPIDSGTTLQ
jgi:methionyl-tRNA formyltransferase